MNRKLQQAGGLLERVTFQATEVHLVVEELRKHFDQAWV